MTPDTTRLDYIALFQKYIAYVEVVEGCHFLDHYRGYSGDPSFTPDEWAELQFLAGVS